MHCPDRRPRLTTLARTARVCPAGLAAYLTTPAITPEPLNEQSSNTRDRQRPEFPLATVADNGTGDVGPRAYG
jgi:hypothetical protein